MSQFKENVRSLLRASVPESGPEVAFVAVGTAAMVGLYTVTAASIATTVAAAAVTAGCLCVVCGAIKTVEPA